MLNQIDLVEVNEKRGFKSVLVFFRSCLFFLSWKINTEKKKLQNRCCFTNGDNFFFGWCWGARSPSEASDAPRRSCKCFRPRQEIFRAALLRDTSVAPVSPKRKTLNGWAFPPHEAKVGKKRSESTFKVLWLILKTLFGNLKM